MKTFTFLLFLTTSAWANVFLHNPRGSNNKHSEEQDNVNNNQRLFKSWNHARGGYNVGPPMYYYVDSELTIEWGNSHSCGLGDENKANCDIVIQYMCSQWLRDGTTGTTVTVATADTMTNSKYTYGMHENAEYFQKCQQRDRHPYLFTADQNIPINRVGSQYTRQNPNGGSFGFECQEERDYYPYWHPTPWKDIAIFTNDESKCDWYKAESQNTQPKGECSNFKYENRDECQGGGGTWSEGQAHGIASPDCSAAPFNRDNSLSNAKGSKEYNRYIWRIPRISNIDDAEHCAIRIRYNISTTDYPDTVTDADNEDVVNKPTMFLAKGVKSPIINMPYIMYGTNNISYAVNTRMHGAVFQDRSHEFAIRERPEGVSNKIYNLNVRGTRGNIVETFPATEYDFIPNHLTVKKNEWIHIQWTGSDYHAANAAGEGTDQTDRNNMVQIESLNHNYPMSFTEQNLFSKEEATRIGFGGMKVYGKLCKTLSELITSNEDDDQIEEDELNCGKMNIGDPYFDAGIQPMTTPGTYYYMSTRNNNYTNRSQKGTIVVEDCTGDDCPQPEEANEGDESSSSAIAVVAMTIMFALLF